MPASFKKIIRDLKAPRQVLYNATVDLKTHRASGQTEAELAAKKTAVFEAAQKELKGLAPLLVVPWYDEEVEQLITREYYEEATFRYLGKANAQVHTFLHLLQSDVQIAPESWHTLEKELLKLQLMLGFLYFKDNHQTEESLYETLFALKRAWDEERELRHTHETKVGYLMGAPYTVLWSAFYVALLIQSGWIADPVWLGIASVVVFATSLYFYWDFCRDNIADALIRIGRYESFYESLSEAKRKLFLLALAAALVNGFYTGFYTYQLMMVQFGHLAPVLIPILGIILGGISIFVTDLVLTEVAAKWLEQDLVSQSVDFWHRFTEDEGVSKAKLYWKRFLIVAAILAAATYALGFVVVSGVLLVYGTSILLLRLFGIALTPLMMTLSIFMAGLGELPYRFNRAINRTLKVVEDEPHDRALQAELGAKIFRMHELIEQRGRELPADWRAWATQFYIPKRDIPLYKNQAAEDRLEASLRSLVGLGKALWAVRGEPWPGDQGVGVIQDGIDMSSRNLVTLGRQSLV